MYFMKVISEVTEVQVEFPLLFKKEHNCEPFVKLSKNICSRLVTEKVLQSIAVSLLVFNIVKHLKATLINIAYPDSFF